MADVPDLFVHRGVVKNVERVPPRPWEVGGWLLGWWADDGRSLFVTHATPPASRGTPFGVTISGRGHQPLFDAAWDATEGAVTFLGDWHTHPGGPATPSKRDGRAMSDLATDPDFGTPLPIIAIIGSGRWPWSRVRPTVGFFIRIDDDQEKLAPRLVERLPPVAARVPAWRW